MVTRLEQLATQIADLGLGLALYAEHDGKRINWRICGTDPSVPSNVNASGCANDEDGAVEQIVNAAHEQLWSGITLDAGAAAEPDLFEEPDFPAPTDKMADWVDVAVSDEDRENIVTGFIDVLKTGKVAVEDAFRQLTNDERAKLFPILNAELPRLSNQEALLGRAIPRKAEVESLIGILARVGEA